MSAPPEKQPDQQAIVALLAEESQLPVDDVAKLYEHEHATLAVGADITKFLHIFATRNVREILRQRGIDRLALSSPGRPLSAAERVPMPLGPAWSPALTLAERAPQP